MNTGERLKILITEDDPVSQRLLSAMLSKHGNCESYNNGQDALTAFIHAWEEGRPYQLVCLDIMMPGMDGHAVLSAIREHEKQRGIPEQERTAVIMVTALSDESSFLKAYDAGSMWYITKPISRERVEEVLADLGLIE